METDKSRRGFLRKAAFGSLAAISIPEIISAALPQESTGIKLLKGRTILFQGDSITDAGRNRKDMRHNSPGALGSGYA
ncbi:MAG: lysophospholipase, partial [Bacteroidales bacterium]|nr:lysophospholipase [Bacteroidales bacterium]